MLEVFGYFLLPVLIIVTVAYFYVQAQKKKAIKAKKRAILLRVTTIKNRFKIDLKRLAEQGVLTEKGQGAIYRIANNFFVFQSISDKSIAYCERLLNNIISSMTTTDPDSVNSYLVQEEVNLFIRSLPATTAGFNATFYRNELPELIKQLVNSQEYTHKTEKKQNNEESKAAAPATAA